MIEQPEDMELAVTRGLMLRFAGRCRSMQAGRDEPHPKLPDSKCCFETLQSGDGCQASD